jgi:hypothetical protein
MAMTPLQQDAAALSCGVLFLLMKHVNDGVKIYLQKYQEDIW